MPTTTVPTTTEPDPLPTTTAEVTTVVPTTEAPAMRTTYINVPLLPPIPIQVPNSGRADRSVAPHRLPHLRIPIFRRVESLRHAGL